MLGKNKQQTFYYICEDEIMSIQLLSELEEQMEQLVYAWMEANEVNAADLTNWPLDSRAKPRVAWVSKDIFVVESRSLRTLDYYGGFEYIGAENRSQYGNFVIFSAECERVQRVIAAIFEEDEEEDEE